MLLPSQPKVSQAARQGPSMHSLSLCVPILPYGTPRTPRAFAHPAWTCRALVGDEEPVTSPWPPHCIPPARRPVSPMQVPLCPLLSPWCPGLGEAGCGWGVSPCPLGRFGGCSNEHPWVLGSSLGSAVCGVGGLSPFPPLPTQKAPGGDRDTGTGSVKIKPLFDWLNTGV